MESCLEHPGIMQDVELMVPIGFDLCVSCIVSGDWQRINRIAPTIISLIERSETQAEFFGKPFNPYSYVLALWGVSTGGCGDFDQGERLLEKALSFALEIDHRGTIGFVEYVYGDSACNEGRREEGSRASPECDQISGRIADRAVRWAWHGLGWDTLTA